MKHYTRHTMLSLLVTACFFCIPGAYAALEPLQTAGTINRAFNPSGFMITSSGARVTGAGFFSGSLVVDLGGDEQGITLDIYQANGNIATAFSTTAGPVAAFRCGLTVTKQDGTLDTSFNPSGLWIINNGSTVTGGYSGTLIVSSVANANRFRNPSVVVDQDSGNIISVWEHQFGSNQPFLNRSIFVMIAKPDGTIDGSFNPSAQRFDDGVYVGPSPFSGVMEIEALGLRNYAPAVAFDQQRKKIIIAFRENVANLPAIIVLNSTGTDPVDRSFNPSGLFIDSAGNYLSGGYAGLLRIDLGGATGTADPAVAVDQETGKIIVATHVVTGPGMLNNIGIIVANPTGHVLLDPLFNSSGDWMQSDGSMVPGGYSGTLIANLGGNETDPAVTFDQELRTIVVACRTTTGAGPTRSLGILNVTETGVRNTQFNPSGVSIDINGSELPNGISGVLTLGTLRRTDAVDVAIDSDRNRIVASLVNEEIVNNQLAVAALLRTGRIVLDPDFNPETLTVNTDGQESPSVFAYTGLFRALLEDNSAHVALAVCNQGSGTIIAGVQRSGNPGDPQLFSINGVTLFPPPPPPPPLSELFQLPYIVMGAA